MALKPIKTTPILSPAKPRPPRAEDSGEVEQRIDPAIVKRRRLKEEVFLMPWRVVLLAVAAWGAVYVYWGMTLPVTELARLDIETLHGVFQFGITLFLAAELLYYAYISYAFRRWRDWGLLIWGFAALVFVLGLLFRIKAW